MHRNQKLLISLLGLIILTGLTWWVGRPSANTVVGREIFHLQDTSQIARIEMVNAGDGGMAIVLERTTKGWLVNNRYRVDAPVFRSLTGRLLLGRIRREVGESRAQEVQDWLRSGRQVTVVLVSGEKLTFITAGNPAKTASYIQVAGEESIYEVEVPGYSMYMSGIFELTENQWRNRLLFASDWRSLQSLTVDYTAGDKEDVEIYFDRSALKVKADLPTDTTALDKYIARFESFYTNEFISPGQIPLYDSLMKAEPFASISIQDIDTSKNITLQVYPQPEESPYMLLADDKGNYSVVEASRFKLLLPSRRELLVE